MNVLDFIIIIILGYNIFSGLKNGAVKIISGTIGLLICFSLSKKYHTLFAPSFANIFKFNEQFDPLIHFFILFLITYFLFQFLTSIVTKMLNISGAGFLNHLVGGALGTLKAFLIISMITIPLMLMKLSLVEESILITLGQPYFNGVISIINNSEYFKALFENLNIPFDQLTSIKD